MNQQTSNGYSIEQFTKEDLPGFLDLHDRVFGGWPEGEAERLFEWKYIENPFIDEIPVVVVKWNGKVVGGNGYFALPLQASESVILGLQSGDLMVHPNHRGQGLFKRMTQFCEDLLLRPGRLFSSFPAERPRQGYLEGGYERISNPEYVRFLDINRLDSVSRSASSETIFEKLFYPLYKCYRNIRDLIYFPSEGWNTFRVDSVPTAILLDLFESQDIEEIHIQRSSVFYAWRYDRPLYDTATYISKRDGETAAAVVVEFDDDTVLVREILSRSSCEDAISKTLRRIIMDHSGRKAIFAWPLKSQQQWFWEQGFLSTGYTPYKYRTSDMTVCGYQTYIGDIDVYDAENWDLQLVARDY